MKNNVNASTEMLQMSNVVYKIKCPVENCESPNPYYIGYTECTIAKRLTFHAQDGGPKEHCHKKHNIVVNRDQLIHNTSIVMTLPDAGRLKIYEALSILSTNPSLNRQHEAFNNVLKLHHSRPHSEQTVVRYDRQTSNQPARQPTSTEHPVQHAAVRATEQIPQHQPTREVQSIDQESSQPYTQRLRPRPSGRRV